MNSGPRGGGRRGERPARAQVASYTQPGMEKRPQPAAQMEVGEQTGLGAAAKRLRVGTSHRLRAARRQVDQLTQPFSPPMLFL